MCGRTGYFGSRKTSEKTTAVIKVADEGDSNQRGEKRVYPEGNLSLTCYFNYLSELFKSIIKISV